MSGGGHCLRPTRRPITAPLTGQLDTRLAAAVTWCQERESLAREGVTDVIIKSISIVDWWVKCRFASCDRCARGWRGRHSGDTGWQRPNNMAVFSANKQLRGSTGDKNISSYDYIEGSSPFSSYTTHLQVRSVYHQEDSAAGSDATAADAGNIQLQHCDVTDRQTSSPIIYPWMKQLRHRKGNIFVINDYWLGQSLSHAFKFSAFKRIK